jgi:periplasmic protein CpxP/Spy
MNRNWLKYIVVCALLLNVATLCFLLFNKQKPPKLPLEVLIEALDLDKEQSAKMTVLKNNHSAERSNLRDEISKNRRLLYKDFTTTTPAQIDSANATIARLYQQIEDLNFQHFKDIRALCRPEQQVEFDNLLLEIVRLLDRKPPPPKGN